mmetsp:Transcript_14066/g.26332  ORF Transcript_14066/g.26332 Transcript_14066/m.26332 type:complete len:308 (-) Transcript_14066:15-938(-)
MATRVLKHAYEILEAWRNTLVKSSYEPYAFYDSSLNAVVTDPALMKVPIYDMIQEGSAVFDTGNLYGGSVYQLDAHISRLVLSATRARIPLPFDSTEIKEIVLEFLAYVPVRDCRLRFFISRGRGQSLLNSSSIMYLLAYNDEDLTKPLTVKDFTVSVPLKPKQLAVLKSNNYLINTLTFLESREKGGYSGIQLDHFGFLAESAAANVAAVLPSGRFVTPKADFILEGTTLVKVLKYTDELISNGLLTSAQRTDITVGEAYAAEELFFVGGDHVIAITELDGNIIGSGRQGPVFQAIYDFLSADRSS